MRFNVAYQFNSDPLIIVGLAPTWTDLAKITRPFTFICHNPSLIRLRNLPRYVRIAKSLPKHANVHFVTNEEGEARLLRLAGLKADCIGQNLHVQEHVYTPAPNDLNRYDAVYISTMLKCKRVHLARKIERLALVTYQSGEKSWDITQWEPRIAHAHHNQTFLPREDVCAIIRASACGLALSAQEGAMLASAEYLLTGRPVVTTPNRGGRNRYFGAGYTITVPPNADKIRDAVKDFLTNPPDPEWIRTETLTRMKRDREKYLQLIHHYRGTTTEEIWEGRGIEKVQIPLTEIQNL